VAFTTQGELLGRSDRFVDVVVTDPNSLLAYESGGLDRRDLLERLCAGGFPEVQRLPPGQRAGWFRDYVRTAI
jgi:hypothetical protein